jgi:hypothetical protein
MALISINADFSRVADALERIAVAAERIAGTDAVDEPYVPRVTQPSDIGRTDRGERASMAKLHELERKLEPRAKL